MVPGLAGVRSMKCQRIEFVVAHDCQGGAGIHHGPDNLEGFPDLGPAVDEVAKKDGLAFRVSVDPLLLGIAESPKEPLEGVSVAVDVTDEVVHGKAASIASSRIVVLLAIAEEAGYAPNASCLAYASRAFLLLVPLAVTSSVMVGR